MKFGYTIIYVSNVSDSIDFFEKAFGLERGFVHPEGDYGELQTGETKLAFATHELGNTNLPQGYIAANGSDKPLGIEIALVTDDVTAAHKQALAAGGKELKAPEQKPWGQTVSYVHCPDGILVELCTPVSG